MISVYESNEKIFNHNGLKVLHPRKCDVFKEDNGVGHLIIIFA